MLIIIIVATVITVVIARIIWMLKHQDNTQSPVSQTQSPVSQTQSPVSQTQDIQECPVSHGRESHMRTNTLRILALHGGGESAQDFESSLSNLQSALGGNVTFVYASAPHNGRLWIRDPPGGKGEHTQDSNWASTSFTVLDDIVRNQGDFEAFDGIIGYSQGSAMSYVYTSANPNYFRFIVTFCGYLPTTHDGLMNCITSSSPLSIPSLFYYGTNDAIITGDMTRAAAAIFNNHTVVYDNGGHSPPTSGHAFNEVVSFINSFIA
tara:strand:- start:35 stop:826 length:792 start_codon:yes stop_codon:yes gene_type:complete